MTAPRQVLPGRTYLITRRCTQRQYLLRPDKQTNQIFIYCLAAAAGRCGIRLLAWTAMSNHYHAVVQDPDGRLPAFLEHFHKLVARALNARWNRWENLWSSDQASAVHLVMPEDIFGKVVYVLANPVADHVVDRVTDWPGTSSLLHTAGTRGTLTIERPLGFFRLNGPMPKRLSLSVAAPEGVDPHEWAARVRHAVGARERAAREERLERRLRVLGRKGVLAASPFDRPSTPEPRRNLHPVVACGDPRARIRALTDLKVFRERYARARAQLVAGRMNVAFPAGSYRWPLLHLASREPAPAPPARELPSA